ncbi:uncharacterized protein KY384_003889 [Bacidia gigantensis]|uniref:uncharacterized protein n=1 Tax=Bacidia gigantensis TaxID=2732470 RepID=UPI001D0395D5|nr:uncharacterized protein KY384_003889 [Bacidia gigantensis]KAG8532248.1 hypothetical protein KY384_003889 [Bacidia gigantensis]
MVRLSFFFAWCVAIATAASRSPNHEAAFGVSSGSFTSELDKFSDTEAQDLIVTYSFPPNRRRSSKMSHSGRNSPRMNSALSSALNSARSSDSLGSYSAGTKAYYPSWNASAVGHITRPANQIKEWLAAQSEKQHSQLPESWTGTRRLSKSRRRAMMLGLHVNTAQIKTADTPADSVIRPPPGPTLKTSFSTTSFSGMLFPRPPSSSASKSNEKLEEAIREATSRSAQLSVYSLAPSTANSSQTHTFSDIIHPPLRLPLNPRDKDAIPRRAKPQLMKELPAIPRDYRNSMPIEAGDFKSMRERIARVGIQIESYAVGGSEEKGGEVIGGGQITNTGTREEQPEGESISRTGTREKQERGEDVMTDEWNEKVMETRQAAWWKIADKITPAMKRQLSRVKVAEGSGQVEVAQGKTKLRRKLSRKLSKMKCSLQKN